LLEDTPIRVIALHRSGKEIAAGKNNAKSQQRFFLSCQTGVADAPLITSTRRLSVERVTEIETALLLTPPATAALTVDDLDNIISSTITTAGKEELSQLVKKNRRDSVMSNHNLFGNLKGEIMKKGFVVKKKKLKKEEKKKRKDS
jgi:hypothetical protein